MYRQSACVTGALHQAYRSALRVQGRVTSTRAVCATLDDQRHVHTSHIHRLVAAPRPCISSHGDLLRRTTAHHVAIPGGGAADRARLCTSREQPPAPSASSTMLSKAKELAPGVAAAAGVMQVGFWGADHLGAALLAAQGLSGGASPVSGIPVSILLGMAINNTVTLPESLRPGLKACTVTALRAGIVCVGAKLSFVDVARLGAAGIPVVVTSIGAGLTFVPLLAKRLGLSAKLGSLVAAGTSICGVTAITALAPAIKANEREVGLAVANVVAFGTAAMLTYPYLANSLLAHSEQIGMFLGCAVHDTSQVIGCALTYKEVFGDELVLKVAAITKLTRNLFLAAVIPGLAWMTARNAAAAGAAASNAPMPKLLSMDTVKKYMPMFVLGFVAMSAARSVGDATLASYGAAYGVVSAEQWKSLTSFVGNVAGSHYLLGTAMAAVGLNTSMSVFKGVGWRPFALGFAGSSIVGLTAFGSTLLAGYFMDFTPEASE